MSRCHTHTSRQGICWPGPTARAPSCFVSGFRTLNRTAERGDQSAYVFVMGSMAEILRTFDCPSSSRRSTLCKWPCAGWRMNT